MALLYTYFKSIDLDFVKTTEAVLLTNHSTYLRKIYGGRYTKIYEKYMGGLPKGRGVTVCRFKRGLGKKKGGGVFEGC